MLPESSKVARRADPRVGIVEQAVAGRRETAKESRHPRLQERGSGACANVKVRPLNDTVVLRHTGLSDLVGYPKIQASSFEFRCSVRVKQFERPATPEVQQRSNRVISTLGVNGTNLD